jgi:LemA protein
MKDMMRRFGSVLALALLLGGCGYNRIQELDERTEQTRSDIDAELMRRNDLIPNLVATVGEVSRFEQETQTGVAQARAGLTAAQQQMAQALQQGADADQVSEANANVRRNMDLFINVSVEAYPTLRANENFIRLQDELTETETRISRARRDYNESVTQYNTYIRRFPQAVTARVIGAGRREQFRAPEEAQQAPRVDFGGRR